LFQQFHQHDQRIPQGSWNNPPTKASELVSSEVVIGNASPSAKVLAIGTRIKRPHWHHKANPVRRGNVAAASSLCQGNLSLSINQSSIRGFAQFFLPPFIWLAFLLSLHRRDDDWKMYYSKFIKG